MAIFILIIGFLIAGCGSQLDNQAANAAPAEKGIVFTMANSQTGLLGSYDVEKDLLQLDLAPVHSDAIVRSFPESDVFLVVNRLGADNIQAVNKKTGVTSYQFSVGRGSNPQDIYLTKKGLWVSFLGEKSLKLFSGSVPVESRSISLTNYADQDGMAESTFFTWVGDFLWVPLQRLNSAQFLKADEKGKLVRFDSEGNQVSALDLLGRNPVTPVKPFGGGLMALGSSGNYGGQRDTEAGIELISSDFQSRGWAIQEETLGGDLTDFLVLNSETGLAVVQSAKSKLVVFEPFTGKIKGTIAEQDAYDFRQLVRDGDSVYLADHHRKNPRILIYNATTLELKKELKLKLPAFHIEPIK